MDKEKLIEEIKAVMAEYGYEYKEIGNNSINFIKKRSILSRIDEACITIGIEQKEGYPNSISIFMDKDGSASKGHILMILKDMGFTTADDLDSVLCRIAYL